MKVREAQLTTFRLKCAFFNEMQTNICKKNVEFLCQISEPILKYFSAGGINLAPGNQAF